MNKKYNTIVLFGDSGARIEETARFTTLKKVINPEEARTLQPYQVSNIMPASIYGAELLQEDEDVYESSLFVSVRYNEETAISNLQRKQDISYTEASQIINSEWDRIDQMPRIDIIIYANHNTSPIEIATNVINKILVHANINDPRNYEYQEFHCFRHIWKKVNIEKKDELAG